MIDASSVVPSARKPLQIVSQFLVNALTVAALYFWQIHGVDQAGNLFVFWMWVVAITTCLSLFVPRKSLPKTRPPRSAAFEALHIGMRLMFIAALVWVGYVVLPAFLALGLLGQWSVTTMYGRDGKLKEARNA